MWPPGPLHTLQCLPGDIVDTTGDAASDQPNSYCCRFCPKPGALHVLASANEDGVIKLWDSRRSAESTLLQVTEAHTNAIYELDWSCDGRHLLSAAGDRVIKLWDAERMSLLAEFRRHSRTVKTVTFLPDDPCVFASGSRDGSIDVWDIRVTRQISHHIHPTVPKQSGARRGRSPASLPPVSVTSLLFRDTNYLLSAVSSVSTVSVWDLRRTYSSSARQPQAVYRLAGETSDRGVACMVADRARAQLYVSGVNGPIQRYSLTSWTADQDAFWGHQCGTFFVRCCLSPCGSVLVAGSSDGVGYLWRTDLPGSPAAKLPGHGDEVTCVAWSRDARTLATLSDDLQLRLWRTDLPAGDSFSPEGTLRMETLRTSLGPILPQYTFRRETGTMSWMPRSGDSSRAPLQGVLSGVWNPSTPRSNRTIGTARTPQTPQTPGSATFLATWLRGGRAGVRTSPRKRVAQAVAETPPRGKENIPELLQRSQRIPSPQKPTRTSPRKAASSEGMSIPGPSGVGSITPIGTPVSPPRSPRTPARPRSSPRKTSAKMLFSDVASSSVACSCGGACVCRTTTNPSTPETPRQRRLRTTNQYQSPTADLPNWVVDGVSPHRPSVPRQRRQAAPDWLTRLSQKKRAQTSPAATAPAEKRPRRTPARNRGTGPRQRGRGVW